MNDHKILHNKISRNNKSIKNKKLPQKIKPPTDIDLPNVLNIGIVTQSKINFPASMQMGNVEIHFKEFDISTHLQVSPDSDFYFDHRGIIQFVNKINITAKIANENKRTLKKEMEDHLPGWNKFGVLLASKNTEESFGKFFNTLFNSKHFKYIVIVPDEVIQINLGIFSAYSSIWSNKISYSSEYRPNLKFKPGYLRIEGPEKAKRYKKALEAGISIENLKFMEGHPQLCYTAERFEFYPFALSSRETITSALDTIIQFDPSEFDKYRMDFILRYMKFSLDQGPLALANLVVDPHM